VNAKISQRAKFLSWPLVVISGGKNMKRGGKLKNNKQCRVVGEG